MRSLKEELEEIHSAHLFRKLKTVESDQDALVTVAGRPVVNFASNNYLGLANHPQLKEAAREATERYGTGSGASRLITGSMGLHQKLEERLAQFKRSEAALVFNSGYHANLGVLTALLREGDEVFSDELNHASIVDGCRLSRAGIKIYRHRDVGHLEELLKNGSSKSLPLKKGGQEGFYNKEIPLDPPFSKGEAKKRRLIVTDSVFSMDGDLAPLKDIGQLAERYGAWLMVDEAHATGVFGKTGRGLVEATWPEGLSPYLKEHLIQMGTLGKALGSFGAYVAGSRRLVEFLINKARSFIYTTALPPGVIAASLAAIDLVEKEPERRQKLWENVEYFSSMFPPSFVMGPIFPFIVGDSQKALDLSQKLFEAGFWVGAIRYPTVARGTERLRITLMATHTKEQMDRLLGKLNEFR